MVAPSHSPSPAPGRADSADEQGAGPAPTEQVGPSLGARALAWVGDNRATVAGVAAGVLVALWLTAGVWGARLPAGGDVTGHLIRAQAGNDLLAHGQLDGWSPRFGVGYQQSLFYGPGFGWLLAGVRLLTFGLLSSAGALKAVMIASFVAVPPAAAFAARSLGLSRRAAGIAAVLSLMASSPFGIGLHGLFENGLVPQQVGGVLFLVALGAAARCMLPKPRTAAVMDAWQVLLALTLAAIVVTHLITLAILALFLGCLVVSMAPTRTLTVDGLRRLVLPAVAAAGLSSFWVLPFLAHRNLHGPVATWSTPPFGTRVADVLAGRVLYKPLAAKVVLAGMAYGLVRIGQRKPYALFVVAGPVAALAIGHWSLHAIPNELTIQLANRELGLAGILLVLPLAAGIGALADLIDPHSGLATVAGVAVAAYLVVAPWGDVGRLARQADAVVPAMRAAAQQLRRVVPAAARFTTIRDYPSEVGRTGTLQPDRWLAWASGRNTLTTFPVEVSSTPIVSTVADRLAHAEPAEVSAVDLARYGVTHVVATSTAQVQALTASARFRPVWSEGTITIVALDEGRPGVATPGSLMTAASGALAGQARSDRGRIDVDVSTPQPEPAQVAVAAAVAVAWSPKWHAEVNGTPVALGRTADGLIQLPLPAGTSHVRLDFRHDAWDVAGLTASLLFVLCGLWILTTGSRRP